MAEVEDTILAVCDMDEISPEQNWILALLYVWGITAVNYEIKICRKWAQGHK